MKNIWLIFTGDLKRCTSNIIGIIVLMGLAIVPTLYAWFNIAASWEPYGNTGNLKVAVVNDDTGYQGDLLPTSVNLGDAVVSQLRENDSFDWQFVTGDEAVEGVESGEYYAALVIPENFSSRIMTVFSDNPKHAKILYYTNEKENPIAPRITDLGASSIESGVSEQFVSTVNEVGVGALSDLLSYLDSGQVKRAGTALTNNLATSANELDTAADQVRSYATLMGSLSSLVSSTSASLDAVGDNSDAANRSFSSVRDSLNSAQSSSESISKAVNEALKQSSSSFDALSTQTDQAFNKAADNADDAASDLLDMASQARTRADGYAGLADSLGQVLGTKHTAVTQLNQAASDLRDLAKTLDSASSTLSSTSSSAASAKSDIDDKIKAANESASKAQSAYESQLLGKLTQVGESLSEVQTTSQNLSTQLDKTVSDLSDASGSLTDQLSSAKKSLTSTADDLDEAASNLRSSNKDLKAAFSSGDLKKVQDIIGGDTVSLADYLASPVQMNRHAVYGIANYGSSMAPFYTCLSLWVAAVVFVVIMRTEMGEERRKEYQNLKPYQEYLGRLGIFALLSLAQSTLLCLGDLYFMGIQCVHPFLFLVAGWIIGLSFLLIVFTLVISFGNVGKALSVILLVMQVAGSGGIFPIQLEGQLFQTLYPFLPFIYAMRAMQSCIAGIFGNDYVLSLITVVAFTIPFWLLGLLLRNPTIRLTHKLKAKMEETKFM